MLNGIVLTLAMASTDGEVVTYVHTDALGSPVAITDSDGKVIERFAYEPYGSVVGIVAADGPGYSGHVFDSTTGLNYMQQRYYSPEIGAFLSVDPVAAYGGKSSLFNRYRYANSSPYNFVDPDGRVPVVTRMKDGSVKISFPTKFSGDGATPKNIATFKEQVASMSGTYDIGGKETRVTVEVTDIEKSTPRAARNEIKLVNGETSHRSGRSFAELGGKKGEINVLDRFDKGVVPHEVSHLGGVDDLYDKTTGLPNPARGDGIMNRVPGVVDSHTIGGIVDGDSAVQERER